MRCWTAAVRHVRGGSYGGDGGGGASRDGETPLPVQPMRVVFLVQFSEAFQHSVLFPFVPFMVASMPSVPEADVGTYVGLVVASFSLGQLVSSYPWGWTAQRFGTKAVVVTSLGTSALCTLVFGFSTSFAMAFSTRFAAGLTNSIMGCVKAYLGRITDASNQSRAMAVMAAASTVGGILGPTVGGLLAAPPAAPGSPLALFPFMLPCIITAVCMLGACVYAAAAMQEPGEVQRRAAAAAEAAAAARDASSCYELVGADVCETAVADDDDDDNDAAADNDARAVEDGSVMRPPAPAAEDEKEEESPLTLVSSSSGSVAILVTPTTEDGGRPDGLLLTRRRPSLGLGHGGSAQRLLSFVSEADTEKGDDDDLAVNNADVGPRKRTMWFAAAMYGYVALCFVILDETYPVFCRESEANGGLGFTSVEIGVVGSITACLSIVYNLLAYPRLAKAYGLMWMLRWSLALCLPMCLCFPLIGLAQAALRNNGLTWTLVLIAGLLRAIVGLNVFTSVMIFINNAVLPEKMATANGVGQTLAAAARTVGPALGGLLWSAALKAHLPGGGAVVFAVAGVMCASVLALTWLYPPSIVHPCPASTAPQ